jgi:hypothetical protein
VDSHSHLRAAGAVGGDRVHAGGVGERERGVGRPGGVEGVGRLSRVSLVFHSAVEGVGRLSSVSLVLQCSSVSLTLSTPELATHVVNSPPFWSSPSVSSR